MLIAISPGSRPPVINNGYITWANLAGDIHTVNLATPHHQQCNRPRSRTGGQSRRILRRRHPPSFGMDSVVVVGTRSVARDCTVARGIAHAIISRPEYPTETNAQDGGEKDCTDVHHNRCPYSHDPDVTTIGKLAHDQHDRPTKTTNDRP